MKGGKMRNLILLISMLLSSILLTGMARSPEGKVPETVEEVGARLFDRGGEKIDLQHFSMDGEVFLTAKPGSGTLTVDFNKQQGIVFGDIEDDFVLADVALKSGETLRLRVRKRAVFYGSTGYGAYSIPAGEVARIEFR